MKGVIFDFNGVIVDDYSIQKEAWNKISIKLRKRGVTDDEMINSIRGVRTEDTLRWMSNSQLSEPEINDLSDEKDFITKNLFLKAHCLN